MRTISFPAQGDYPECSLALPYSRNAAEFTIFHTPLGWRYATGTGNVLTGIAGEEKVLEIALWGAAGSRVGWAAVTDVVISDAPDEIVLQDARDSKKAEIAAARWAEMSTPTAVDGYEAIWYADKESMNDMLRASSDLQTAIALGHLPENSTVQWKTAEGTFVTLGLNDMVTIRLLLSQRQQGLYAKEAGLVEQIEAAESLDDLEMIVW